MVVWGGLKNSWENKRRERQRKKKKGIPYPSESEFQIIAKRDKKAFLNEQCKEMEDNNRLGKTRALFKKIRDN